MEDMDDDFSELYEALYADVEVQASSAIKGAVPTISQSRVQKVDVDDDDKESSHSGSKTVDSSGGDELEKVLSSEVNDDEKQETNVDSGSDSEDDLNVVLNSSDDDDDVAFPFPRGVNLGSIGFEDGDEEEENGGFGGSDLNKNPKNVCNLRYKCKRPNPGPSASNSNHASLRGDHADNGFNFNQSGHNFSLPRSQSILDVNVDKFEQKPWRRPGVDITDFFNYGFDEDNWRQYCKDLNQRRHEKVMSNSLRVRKGKAIRVEDSISEHQANLDSECPLKGDSNVIKDSKDDSSGSNKEGLGHINSSEHKASKDGDFCVDDSRDNKCDSGAFEDEQRSEHSKGSKSYGLQRKPGDGKHYARHGSSVQEEGNQSVGVETDQYLSRYSNESKYFLEQAISRVHYEAMAREWYRYLSGFAVQKENERGDWWKGKEEEESHFRKRMKGYCFPHETRYRNDFTRGKYRRSPPPYNRRNRENFYGRGKFKNAGRSKRRCGSPSIRRSDDLCSSGEEDEFLKWRDRRSLSSRSYKEPYAANRRWHGTMSTQRGGYERHGRHEKYRREIWSRRFDSKRGYSRFGRLNDDRDVVRHRSKMIREGNRGNQFDRSSNVARRGIHERTLPRLPRCGDLVDSNLGTVESSGRYSDAGSTMYKGKHKNTDSNIDLDMKTLNNFNESKVEENQNSEEWIDKFLVTQPKEVLDIEEGQIMPEETSESAMENLSACDNAVQVSEEMELGDMSVEGYDNLQILEEFGDMGVEGYDNPQILELLGDMGVEGYHNPQILDVLGDMGFEGYDSPQILEVTEKMEKRRERFKDPITLGADTGTGMSLVEETVETKQERPARKRKWGEETLKIHCS